MEQLGNIAIFVRVVEAGGFTAAAEVLKLSQPFVSRSVTALEQHLGVRLLQRSTRRISLTEAGGELYRRAVRGLTEIEEAELEVTRFQTEPRGLLRVTAPTSFTLMQLAPMVRDFLARYPAVRLDLQLQDQQVDIIADGFDLAIRIATLEDSQLVARRIAPAHLILCASPGYFERHRVPRTPQELLQHECIVYTYGRDPGKWRFRGSDDEPEIVVPVQGPVHTNNGLVEKQAALDGVGLALLPTFYVSQELSDGRLVAVPMQPPPVTLGIHAVYAERRGLSPKVRALVDFMQDRLAPVPPWDLDLPPGILTGS